MALGASDGTIEIWDVGQGKFRKSLRGHDAAITALAFSEDGELLASGSEDLWTIRLWQTRSGKLLKSTKEGKGLIRTLAFSLWGTGVGFRRRWPERSTLEKCKREIFRLRSKDMMRR